MTITLPLPPSKNNLRYSNHTKTAQYRKFESQSDMIWIRDGFNSHSLLNPTYDNQMLFDIRIYLKDLRSDPENYFEALRDWLKGKLYSDDKWVFFQIVNLPLEVDKHNPRIEINLSPRIFSKPKQIKVQAI